MLSFDDILANEHVQATGMFTVHQHPSEGSYKHIRSPVRFAGTPSDLMRFAPRAGEHTREIIEELQLPGDVTERLIAQAPANEHL